MHKTFYSHDLLRVSADQSVNFMLGLFDSIITSVY